MKNIIVLSPPRCGSSLLCEIVKSAGYRSELFEDSTFLAPSTLNKIGYNEEVRFTLLNDQLLRLFYNDETSFLHTSALTAKPTRREDFNYDINEHTLWIPESYEERIFELTGNTWDVWGLTRMVYGGKWYKCYSRHNVQTEVGVCAVKSNYENLLNSSHGYVLKDPRLALTMQFYDFDPNHFKVLYVTRTNESIIKSCRNHYGPGLFKNCSIDGTELVSNHFNYKIKFQDFDEWMSIYNHCLKSLSEIFNIMVINYEDLLGLQKDTIDSIEEFLEFKIDMKIVNPMLRNF